MLYKNIHTINCCVAEAVIFLFDFLYRICHPGKDEPAVSNDARSVGLGSGVAGMSCKRELKGNGVKHL